MVAPFLIGIDLAKNVFQVHNVNERAKTGFKKQLKRAQVLTFFANLPPCLIGMEARGSALNIGLGSSNNLDTWSN
jgi:transposase